MSRHFFILFTLLMGTSLSATANIKIPKQIIIDLIDSRCDNPDPNPSTSSTLKPILDYDCSEKYEDSDGDEQSMNYSLRLLPLIKDDFNQDGIQDIALEIESMGPLGGSVTTNSGIHYLLLNKNQKVINDHEVLLYAPFSEHIVEYHIEGSQISYSAIPNYRSHPEAYEDGELIDSPLEFEVNWVNGAPISDYYRDNCRMSDMTNKKIFTAKQGVTRLVDIDMHDYTQVIEEELKIGNTVVSATLNGCNEPMLTFDVEPSAGYALPVLADVLQALIPVTYQHQQLKELLKLDKASQIGFGKSIPLSDGWRGQIHINRSIENSSIRINLSQAE